ncbi:phosphodiesterase YaeI [Bryobacterales bacterium F-183]|nr:phosphodiesterase YaeI [Bryobacterales bacterium F-183]
MLAGGGLTAGSYVYAETRWFEVSRTTITLPGLPAPLRLLHLADLHSSLVVPTPLLIDAVDAGIAQKPDAVVLTGDYISSFRQFDEQGLRMVFRKLAKAAPTYAVMGNHDDVEDSTEYLRNMLADEGVRVLHNDSAVLSTKGLPAVELTGLGDLWNKTEFEPQQAFAARQNRRLPSIVLAHNPDTKDAIANEDWNLMLSGHTHGGQVLIPFVKPTWAPVEDKRFLSGLHTWEDRQLYITRGVGNHSGVRFRCRPEVSILNLKPGPYTNL